MAGNVLWSAPGLGAQDRYSDASEGAGFKFTRPYWGRSMGSGALQGNQQQQMAQASSQAITALANIMSQRKKDAIAQSLMQQELANRPDLLQRYAQAGLTGQAAYQQMNDDLQGEEQQRQNWLKDQIMQQHLNSPAGNTVEVQLPDGRTVKATADAALQYYMRGGSKPAAADRTLNTLLAKHGMTTDDLNGVDFSTPGDQGGIQYGKYDASGQFIPTDTASALKAMDQARATRTQSGMVARGGGLENDVPLEDFMPIAARYRALSSKQPNAPQQQQALNDPSGDPNATPAADNPDAAPSQQSGGGLVARAQQALSDPNASAQAKAAAQQILANAGSDQ